MQSPNSSTKPAGQMSRQELLKSKRGWSQARHISVVGPIISQEWQCCWLQLQGDENEPKTELFRQLTGYSKERHVRLRRRLTETGSLRESNEGKITE
jgi:hypothetical protein